MPSEAPPSGTTSTTAPPATTPLPIRSSPHSTAPAPSTPIFPLPKLRLEIRDLTHPGASIFLTSVTATTALASAVQTVLRQLYLSPTEPSTQVPPTRSVTLILRSMDGVAYTIGTDLDNDHKEIHFSLEYITSVSAARYKEEIEGVLVHEMVHCLQYNGSNTCPGGLIEGIADWVRLKAGLAPPHWRRSVDGTWDGGYDKTAYFLEWLEAKGGEGVVRQMNEMLREGRYVEGEFWAELLGEGVQELWAEYGDVVKGGE